MFEKAFIHLRVSLIQQEELTLTNGVLITVKRTSVKTQLQLLEDEFGFTCSFVSSWIQSIK